MHSVDGSSIMFAIFYIFVYQLQSMYSNMMKTIVELEIKSSASRTRTPLSNIFIPKCQKAEALISELHTQS